MVQHSAEGQAVLAHQPDPLAAGPGQLGGVVARVVELAAQDLGEQPRRAGQVADVVLDQAERGRRAGRGQPGGRRVGPGLSGLLGDLDDDAVRVPGMQERLLPVRIVEADPDPTVKNKEGLDAMQVLERAGLDEVVELLKSRP